MKAVWNGATVAESDDIIVIEGNHYFPMASVEKNTSKIVRRVPSAHGKAPRATTTSSLMASPIPMWRGTTLSPATWQKGSKTAWLSGTVLS